MDSENNAAWQAEALSFCCANCNKPIDSSSRFCRYCGTALSPITENSTEEKWSAIKQSGLFFLICAISCCVFSFVPYFDTINWSIAFYSLLAAVAIIFFTLNWSSLKHLLAWSNFSLIKLIASCVLSIIGSVTVSFVVGWINHSLYHKDVSYYAFYLPHQHSIELAIFFTAIVPALSEELGYRGFLLGKLLKVTDTKQAIFISSFVFAIMHRAIISLFWLIPFALIIARIRIKEKTLWYGICIHFCFNLTATLLEIVQYYHH